MSVNPDQDQHRRNRLLAALRPRDYALLEPHLQLGPPLAVLLAVLWLWKML
jgi:hypothetical protein